MFNHFPRSDCEIVNPAGELVGTTQALFDRKVIIVTDTKISIAAGDEIRRRLPSGQDDVFEVIEPTFYQNLHGIPAHYQIQFKRKGTFGHRQGGNYTLHVSGNNARVNVGSHDQSTNIVVGGDVLGNLTTALKSGVSDQQRLEELLAAVNEMRAAKGKSNFAAAYQKFVALCAEHITIVAPFLPALASMIPH